VTPGLVLPESVVGIEVYNAGCELEIGRGLASVHWDELLETGRLCPAIASDDSHHPGYDTDLAWTWLNVGERSRAGVLEALASGRYSASTGPRIYEVVLDGTSVEVRSSPCRTVTLVSGRSLGASVTVGRLGYRHEAASSNATARAHRPRAARGARRRPARARRDHRSRGRKAWANPFRV
jgi:hypothetical protein